MTTITKLRRTGWNGPDMGGAYWLEGTQGKNQAVVCEDPTGETKRYFWSVIIDEYANEVAHGCALTLDEAGAAAATALAAYEGSK